ncbi:MAG: aminoacyl-tRNA hydrolase [Dehalococcoidia bacterium]|nr:MAG: aminoacyl-tRNA hydrolase [Dehalococcoidia bacterium]
MKLIVGLGNPGNQYAHNRHNIGFMCVSHFAKERDWGFEKKEGLARTAHGRIDGEEIVLARPQTFMNASGEAVKKLTIKYRIKPEDLIVVHDEMDLRLGIIRIRRGGGTAGHNGVESIIRELGTADFVRVRVGVGHPRDAGAEEPGHVVGYVLGDFSGDEAEVIKKVIAEADQAIMTLIRDGLETAMNRFNKTNAPKADKPEKSKDAPVEHPGL